MFPKVPCTIVQFGLILIAGFLICCNGGKPEHEQKKQELPAEIDKQLQAAIEAWNKRFGDDVRAVSYTIRGTIDSEQEKERVLKEITSPGAMVPVTSPEGSAEISAKSLAETDTMNGVGTPSGSENLRKMLSEIVNVGQQVVLIEWQQGQQSFHTTSIVNEQGLVYDNMLSNVALTEQKTPPGNQAMEEENY